MKRIVAGVALATSLLVFIVIVGTGLFLAVVEQSGAQGPGFLLALGGMIAFAAALYVGLAPESRFRTSAGKAFGAVATFLAVAPLAALACAALVFAGLPLGSTMPVLDWAFFALGAGFLLGAIAMAALGYVRITNVARPEAERTQGERPLTVVSSSGERLHAGLM